MPQPLTAARALSLPSRPVFAVSGGAKVPGGVRTAWQLLGDYVKEGLGALVVTAILLANPHMHWFPRHWLYSESRQCGP